MNRAEQELDFLRQVEEEEEPLVTEETAKIIKLLGAKNAEVRYRAAVTAGIRFQPEFEEPLIKLLKDKRRIIRVNACDSLSNSGNMAAAAELLPMMTSRYRLERGYALLSFSDITINAGTSKEHTLAILRPFVEAEKDDWAKVFGIEAMAQLGEREVLVSLYRLIGSKDHHARLVSVKCAERFADEIDSAKLISGLTEQLARETDVTLIGQIIRLLDQLNEK
ncbi:MAG TPA: HEAT repeat domain-containing protein [Candidatus Cryosericum sp.]|nr:HEAT repeat domain-containing protein [Candidatus Cryosericum sp.]